MRPCPVCEAPVSGWACEVCGTSLGAPPVTAPVVTPLEGLELTDFVALPTLGLSLDPPPELERTLRETVPEVPGEPLLGWEATEILDSPDVPAGGLADVDLGRETQVDPPTVVPAGVTCRYCRNVQTRGVFCDRCGMQLPRPFAHAEATPAASEERVSCPRCFERTPVDRPRCGACGALLRTDD